MATCLVSCGGECAWQVREYHPRRLCARRLLLLAGAATAATELMHGMQLTPLHHSAGTGAHRYE